MFSLAAMQPLAHSLPPAAKAGGFLLTLGTVLTAHILPLVWVLVPANSSVLTTQPPVLTGILVQQPASQAAAAQSSPKSEQKRVPEQMPERKPETELIPEPVRAPAKTTAVKQPNVISAKPDKPVTKPVQPATPAERPPEPVSLADTATVVDTVADTVVDTVADNAATKHSAAAAAVPVSAPVLNATVHYNAPPLYPQLSRKLREQGTVVLQLTVLASGKVADVTVAQSSGYARLDKAALLAVQHWRYQPAQRGGQAIAYRYRQRLEFSLTEGVK
ncbi:energy transducer TonB [Rheinheimera baltica]|uniref:energy transducer TonB n=1 Tax=Rheinheimera baltica TaxID=67576 RepID=UPI00273DA16A|nr:energy transducer TonB [Rheinheimera baltica]MDP5142786.1 energy transducer TonB [Rheinheimera baltica]